MTSSDNPLHPRPMKYVGEEEPLKDKTALVTLHGTYVMAQFDDIGLGAVAYSWHRFEVDEFEPVKTVNGGTK